MRWLYALVAVLAALAGAALWLAMRPPSTPAPQAGAPEMAAPGAVLAAVFHDLQGRPRTLGEFQGQLVVLNIWATWCTPCRQEMPAFERLQARWADRGVRFVGLSTEEPAKVAAFARSLGITYPLWVGGDEVGELSRRLGNSYGVLPHTLVFRAGGPLVTMKMGTYTEPDLERILEANVAKTAELPPKSS